MSVTVTRTKIIVPKRRPDLLSRSRLISAFDDVLDYPFTLISAPAGYGKTSLMIDLAYQANYPICWFSLDPLDLDPNRFLTHFVQALRIKFPTFGSEALSLLENQANPLQNPTQVVSILINEIYQRISEHFVIFLDDFHHLNADREICSFISQFGQEMDDNTHLVMASRTLFDFPDLTLLIGRRMVKGIGFDELAFQTNEIKSYYREILDREITDKETKNLLDRTEGWITGLVFSADTDLAHLPGPGNIAKITGADLFQYLAEQVLDKQTPDIQDFLMRSSLLEEFNSDFCDLVLGLPDTVCCSEMIFDLQQKNLFVQQVEDENSWIRYHSLFRDFLRNRFHDRYPEDEKKIYRRILEIYLDSESWEKAFAAANQIGSPEIMAEVIDKASSTLIHQGRMKLLSSWLELLPDEGFEILPKLILLHAISITSLGNPKKGLSFINDVLKKPEIINNHHLYTRALLCRITTSRMLGQYKDAISDIENIFQDISSVDIDEKLVAETHREAALAYLNISNYSKSKKHFTKSINNYQHIGDINNQALVHQDLGLLLMEYGSYHEASSHFAIALETWERLKNTTQQSNILNNIGTLSVLTGNYKDSSISFKSAIKYSEASSNLRMLAFSIASQGDLAKSISSYEVSLGKYDFANTIAEQIQEGFLLVYLSLNRSTTYRYLGEIDNARSLLQMARTFILQGSSRNELGLWHLEMGFQQLGLKDHQAAQESFLQAESIFISTGKPVELAKARMGLVLNGHQISSSRSVKQLIKDWVTCLIPLETNQPLLPELHFQVKLFNDVIDNNPRKPVLDALRNDLNAYSKQLSQWQREIFPEQSPYQIASDNLVITALGQNLVLVNGNKIDSPEWIYQKTVRELFFYLLTLPRGATKEQIGLIFWPDSSPTQLTCQFKNTIYRMRRAIGRGAILYNPETKSYSFNREKPYSYDVENFLSLLQRAKEETHPQEQIEYYQEAAALYNHPYSPQLGGVWAEPIRQSLSRKYEQALLVLAKYKLDQNQNQECISYCQKIFSIEPCQEKAYQFCMNAYANLSDRNGILRVYTECFDNLYLIYGIDPSAETKQLKERLIK